MKQLIMIVLMVPFLATAQNFEEALLSMSVITVKQGHNAQFTDGVSKWKECYNENEGTNKWNFWSRVQGAGNVYGLTGWMSNWAEMDQEDPAGEKCYMTAVNFIIPHIEKSEYSIASTLPDWSKKTMATDTKLVWVTYFRIKNRSMFNEVIKEITGTIRTTEGEPRGQWYTFEGGGEMDPDYMVVSSYNGYAALDVDRDGPWSVYENVHGKKKTDELRTKYMAAVDSSWSYLWNMNEKLSNQ
jgi:hypothetical protein